MSPEAQCKAVAEACPDLYARWTAMDTLTHPASFDPLQDLNLMHEAEKELDITNGGPRSGDCLRYTYSSILYKLCPEWVQPFRATAAQRAEAFLRTLNLWDDSK